MPIRYPKSKFPIGIIIVFYKYDLIVQVIQSMSLSATSLVRFNKLWFSYKVSVFYCGASQAADIIQPICDQFDFKFKKEIF